MHPRKNASLPSPVRSMVPPPPPSFYVCFYWEKSATYSSFFKYSHNVFLRGISHSCKIGGIIQFTPYFILCTGCGRTIALPCRKNNGSRGQKLSSGDKNYPPGTKIVLRRPWSPPGKNTPLFNKIRTVWGYFLRCFLSPGGSPETTFCPPGAPPENWVYLARYALFQHV